MWSRSRTNASRDCFIRLRNECKNLIIQAKKRFMNQYIPNNIGSKELWRKIRNLDITDTVKYPISFSVDNMNRSFALSSPPDISNNVILEESIHNENDNQCFSFRNVTLLETYFAVTNIKSNSIGCDGVQLKFVKLILPIILPYIAYLFNNILTTSIFPSTWKIAKVIPLPKTCNPRSLKDLRPISILSCLSKAFERLVKVQIQNYIDASDLLSDRQSGFRNQHSTESALLTISLSFSRSARKLRASYLANRQQFVCYDGDSSQVLTLHSGVPQGSILGPLLFSLFINDLPSVLRHTSCRMFADDVQIYMGDKAFAKDRIAADINSDLEQIAKWAEINKLQLNPIKSQGILFSVANNDFHVANFPPIRLMNCALPLSTHVKNLGVVMDSKLSWDNHIISICGKIYSGLRRLWASSSMTTLNLRKRLVRSLLVPQIIYCSTIMGCLNATVFCKLQRAYFSCLRYIYKVDKFSSVSHLSKDFLGCSLKCFLKFRVCFFIYKLLRDKCPAELYNKLSLGNSTRTSQLRVPRNRTSVKNTSFFVYGVSLYNSIPVDIRNQGLFKFKKLSLEYFSNLPN